MHVIVEVNGQPSDLDVDPRTSLADCLRDQLELTGVHLGCEHGVCGACTVLLDGRSVRSCLLFAVQANGHRVTTVEGLTDGDGLHPVQAAFIEKHGLQCGFCTPGLILTTCELLSESATPSADDVRVRLGGNLCRCTGYIKVFEAVARAAELSRSGGSNRHTFDSTAEVEQ
jgi:carbon-monoxide dehydrogenase small subunit